MGNWEVHLGNAREVLAEMAGASVDAIVTDPPYSLGFMGKVWDRGVDHSTWAPEALRVLKPGGHLVAFGGTRTFHRLTCALEDAGFEIRDCLMWLYGTGFPKSKNIGGGWGTALKPAWEPIILARKPLVGTVAESVLAHGTGALNVDGCRIAVESGSPSMARRRGKAPGRPGEYGYTIVSRITPERYKQARPGEMLGRWPANVVLDEGAAQVLDEQSGDLGHSSGTEVRGEAHPHGIYGSRQKQGRGQIGKGDRGGASRFFYTAKASSRERHYAGNNTHPTVKPVALMRWLCRLVAPKDGLVLDPFTGSGSTGVAALAEGFRFLGIDNDPASVALASLRIEKGLPPI